LQNGKVLKKFDILYIKQDKNHKIDINKNIKIVLSNNKLNIKYSKLKKQL